MFCFLFCFLFLLLLCTFFNSDFVMFLVMLLLSPMVVANLSPSAAPKMIDFNDFCTQIFFFLDFRSFEICSISIGVSIYYELCMLRVCLCVYCCVSCFLLPCVCACFVADNCPVNVHNYSYMYVQHITLLHFRRPAILQQHTLL